MVAIQFFKCKIHEFKNQNTQPWYWRAIMSYWLHIDFCKRTGQAHYMQNGIEVFNVSCDNDNNDNVE